MSNNSFSITFTFSQPATAVFNAINDVPGWWSEDFHGHSVKTGDEFEVRFGEVHYSRQKLVEVIAGKKVVWLVTDSHLNFLQKKDEWTGTTISFEIAEQGVETKLHFTHFGLVPEIECFKDCSKGWNYYLQNSLVPLIRTGTGQPNREKNIHATNK